MLHDHLRCSCPSSSNLRRTRLLLRSATGTFLRVPALCTKEMEKRFFRSVVKHWSLLPAALVAQGLGPQRMNGACVGGSERMIPSHVPLQNLPMR